MHDSEYMECNIFEMRFSKDLIIHKEKRKEIYREGLEK